MTTSACHRCVERGAARRQRGEIFDVARARHGLAVALGGDRPTAGGEPLVRRAIVPQIAHGTAPWLDLGLVGHAWALWRHPFGNGTHETAVLARALHHVRKGAAIGDDRRN